MDYILFDKRGDAEAILENMLDILNNYGFVTVADLHDLTGLDCVYTDNNYGWNNLNDACVIRVRNGYALKLSRPTPIK